LSDSRLINKDSPPWGWLVSWSCNSQAIRWIPNNQVHILILVANGLLFV